MYNQRGKKSQKAIYSLSSSAILGVINYYDNGNKKYEAYYKDGIRHRDNRPVAIYYCKNGNIQSVES